MSVRSGPAAERQSLSSRPEQTASYSRALKVTLAILDRLHWRLAEAACSLLFVLRALTSPDKIRIAGAWGRCHATSRLAGWRVTLRLFMYQGRFRARHALLGIHAPSELKPLVRVEGEHHIPAASPVILLALHVGAPGGAAALASIGRQAVFVGGRRVSPSWSRREWHDVRESAEDYPLSESSTGLGAALYRAQHHLLEGRSIYLYADGGHGRELFDVIVDPAPAHSIKAGWLALHQGCLVPVLPVLSHYEASIQVVTIYPPLPAVKADSACDISRCRESLTQVIAEFARSFPEQCAGLVFAD